MKIIINHAGKKLGSSWVLKDICLSMESGFVYGLQGINGSGKTMLLRAISGLIKLSEGSILVNDKRLGKDISFPPHTGLLLESPSFLDFYTGKQNLELLWGLCSTADSSQAEKAMLRVGLNPNDRKKYKKYSLGMKQRLGIAAAIMEHPKLLILDEPMNALDEKSQQLTRQIILEEKERGSLIIIACHDAALLKELSDIIYVIDNGKIVERLYANDTMDYTAQE